MPIGESQPATLGSERGSGLSIASYVPVESVAPAPNEVLVCWKARPRRLTTRNRIVARKPVEEIIDGSIFLDDEDDVREIASLRAERCHPSHYLYSRNPELRTEEACHDDRA